MQRKMFGLAEILSNSFWAIDPLMAENYRPIIYKMLSHPEAFLNMSSEIEDSTPIAFEASSNLYPISAYGNASSPEDAPKNSVAVISFDGAITKNDQICGDSGTVTKAALIERCFENSKIEGLVLHITSPGGSANAISAIRFAMQNKNKPVVAYVDDYAASAGYWIASFADEIVVSDERARVGSIGSYITLADWDKYYESKGLIVRDIYSTYSTEKNKEVRDALNGDDSGILAFLDKSTNFFLNDVKKGRPSLNHANDPKILQGAMYFGDDAVSNGLADYMGRWQTVLERIDVLKSNYKKEGGFYV